MLNILGSIFIVVLVCFATNINNKTKKLKDSGASEVKVDFSKGSICGKVDSKWNCENMYVIKVKVSDDKSKN